MKVRIREWSEMEEEYGIDEDGDINCDCGFIKDMREYCGEVFEVHELTLVEGIFTYDNWIFSDDMYEIIEE